MVVFKKKLKLYFIHCENMNIKTTIQSHANKYEKNKHVFVHQQSPSTLLMMSIPMEVLTTYLCVSNYSLQQFQ